MEINALGVIVKTKLRPACLPVHISHELCSAYRCKSHRNLVPACRSKSHRNCVLSAGPNLTGTLCCLPIQISQELCAEYRSKYPNSNTDPNITRTLCLRAGPNITSIVCAVPVHISQELCTEYRSRSHRNFALHSGPDMRAGPTAQNPRCRTNSDNV